MKEKLGTKSVGFYFAIAAGILAIISTVRYLIWAPNHSSMDAVIIVALIIGIILDVILILKDNDYIVILAVICYSIAAVKLLTNSVGSFVDAFQGIKMFGDVTQVSTIISISLVMGGSVLLSIIAGFLNRVKE